MVIIARAMSMQFPSVDDYEVYTVAETSPHRKPTDAKQMLEKRYGGNENE